MERGMWFAQLFSEGDLAYLWGRGMMVSVLFWLVFAVLFEFGVMCVYGFHGRLEDRDL
jgi:uncharacterized membrane protein